MAELKVAQPEIQQVLCGKCVQGYRLPQLSCRASTGTKDHLSIKENSPKNGTEISTAAMFSQEFHEWSEPTFRESGGAWRDALV